MSKFDTFLKEAEEKGIKIKKDLSMKDYTTFRIGGCADMAVFPESREELVEVLSLAKKEKVPFYVVGKGSNLLVSDLGYRGLAVFTFAMDKVTFEGNTVCAQAGANLTSLSRAAAQQGLSGLEFACGIPGTVGGAVYMNAGAYGSEMKNVTVCSHWWSPTLGFGTFHGEEQGFDYRHSAYMDTDKIILGCSISLTHARKEEVEAYCRDLLARRRDKQPLEFPSAGSTFKRYPGRYTGQMIEEAGLKGYSVGGARVSEKHAGFVINGGGATSKDVIALMEYIKEKIFEKEGIEIESEIRYLAEEGEVKL